MDQPPVDNGDEPPEGSLTVNPLVAWGAWRAARDADAAAPAGWIVLLVVLGPVVLLVGLGLLAALR